MRPLVPVSLSALLALIEFEDGLARRGLVPPSAIDPPRVQLPQLDPRRGVRPAASSPYPRS